ncbi:ABC transporter ATP-binding protein [Streptacidiphilus pinicola]|uniref:ABC transporter ATP-binding protein n=1 Tax=Streptacidiphilus pinicola TaxID=2219663 RepID=A0A2X0KKP5_9ACTN|nr:ABC transporter ATP-binding protein [Streptacidiphilus pinicola]RAG87250.1 ABC transporter ATP-binding protein [Streptacidiphilus pinicola]
MTAVAAPGLQVSGVDVDLERRPVVREVSCTVAQGGWLALIGPNGAGKSTLLRALAGLLPHRGSVVVDGTDVGRLRARERARLIGYVPQAPLLPPDMTVQDYVLLGRTPHLGYLANPGERDRAATRRTLDALDLGRLAERRLSQLSGGERQRAALARALAQEPRLLLLDEPTSALDLGHQQHVLDLVDGLRRTERLTVVTTLHDLTTAAQYADRLVLLHRGRVEAGGTPAEVVTQDVIARVYDARVTVTSDPDGRPVVTPLRGGPPASGR